MKMFMGGLLSRQTGLIAIAILVLSGCSAIPESTQVKSSEDTNQETGNRGAVADEQQAITLPPRSPEFAISAEAVSRAQSLIDGSYESDPSQLIVSENIGEDVSTMALNSMGTAGSMWDESYGVVPDYKVILFTAKDAAWAEAIRRENGDRIWLGDFVTHIGDSDICSFGVAVGNRIYMCLADGQSAPLLAALIPHEYFHLIQNQMGITTQLPVWLIEGTAAFFGDIALPMSGEELTLELGDRRSYAMSEFLGQPKLSYNLNELTEEKFLEIFEALEIPPVNNVPAVLAMYEGYLWSFLAVQFLVAEHGVDGVTNYLEAVGAKANWRTQFQASFGQNLDSFYSELRERIILTYTR